MTRLPVRSRRRLPPCRCIENLALRLLRMMARRLLDGTLELLRFSALSILTRYSRGGQYRLCRRSGEEINGCVGSTVRRTGAGGHGELLGIYGGRLFAPGVSTCLIASQRRVVDMLTGVPGGGTRSIRLRPLICHRPFTLDGKKARCVMPWTHDWHGYIPLIHTVMS